MQYNYAEWFKPFDFTYQTTSYWLFYNTVCQNNSFFCDSLSFVEFFYYSASMFAIDLILQTCN